MATKTANFNMRIDANQKKEAEKLYSKLGLKLSQAVNMFISQSLLVGGLPFNLRVPSYSAETEAAMREAKAISNGKIKSKSYNTATELFEELDAEC